MPNIFVRGKKVFVRHRTRNKREIFKAEDSLSKIAIRHRRVCANCGHSEFAVVKNNFSWLFG